ncbi:helix-turn-helix transcriptional regulator [Jiella sonneratiae]
MPQREAPPPSCRRRRSPSNLGISRCTLWRMERNGDFPPAIPVGPKSKRWRRTDIEMHLKRLQGAA